MEIWSGKVWQIINGILRKDDIRFSFGVYFKEQFTNVKNATSIYCISLRLFFHSNKIIDKTKNCNNKEKYHEHMSA